MKGGPIFLKKKKIRKDKNNQSIIEQSKGKGKGQREEWERGVKWREDKW